MKITLAIPLALAGIALSACGSTTSQHVGTLQEACATVKLGVTHQMSDDPFKEGPVMRDFQTVATSLLAKSQEADATAMATNLLQASTDYLAIPLGESIDDFTSNMNQRTADLVQIESAIKTCQKASN